MKLIIASEADLNAYVDQIERLRDTSPRGISRATQQMAELEGAREKALGRLAGSNPLTDKSVGGVQHAIDVIESADPYGLRTTLPAHVEELARLKDVSPSGIEGATALIRVVKREDLTDKTVRGHTRARDAMEAAPSIAVEVERKPAPVEQKAEDLVDQIASQLARARDAVVGWVKSFVS